MVQDMRTSGPPAVLRRTEMEIAALLVAGLSTHRSGLDRPEELAAQLTALKLDRLAAELRKLAAGGDPAAMVGSALTALAMARKIRERLLPWVQGSTGPVLSPLSDPAVRIAVPAELPEVPDLSALVAWLESGSELLRAHAAALLVRRGEESLPELVRLAGKGTVAVRREAIAAIGKIGGPAAPKLLVELSGDIHCWRALRGAILPYGPSAVPLVADVLATRGAKKGQDSRRIAASALLYRLGEHPGQTTLPSAEGENPMVYGFALASHGRAGGTLREPAGVPQGTHWDGLFLASATIAVARAEATDDLDTLFDLMDGGAVNEVRLVARWAATGSSVEGALIERYLGQMVSGGKAKDRERAASVLRGLANPAVVPPLAGLVAAGAVDLGDAAEVLGEVGGSHAVGLLLDLAPKVPAAWSALVNLGDPGAVPALLDLLAAPSTSAESALVAMGDSAVDSLAREMRAREGTPMAPRLQQVLLRIRTRRAKEALAGTGADTVEALLSRLGHPQLGAEAAKALAKKGESVLDALERVLVGATGQARVNTLGALGGIGGPRVYNVVYRAVEESLQGAAHGDKTLTCTHGFNVLVPYGDPRTAPLLARALASPAYTVQQQATEALVMMGPGVAPAVTPLLEHSGGAARSRALEVLGRLRVVEIERKAIDLLSDPEPGVRAAAATALGHIGQVTGDPATVRALGAALGAARDFQAMSIVQAMAEIGRPEAIPYLRRFAEAAPSGAPAHDAYYRNRARDALRKIEAMAAAGVVKGVAGKLRRFLGGGP